MKTETLEELAKKESSDYGNLMKVHIESSFINGYNSCKEQLKPLIESHSELLAALNEVIAYEKRGADKGEPRIGNNILSTIKSAIEKAKQITI